MKNYALLVCLCLFLITGCAHTPINIDGTWQGELKRSTGGGMGGMGMGGMAQQPMRFTFNFETDGNALTGSVNGGPGQWIQLEEGEIKGNKITFNVPVTMGQMKMTVKYEGKIKGDEIKMKFKNEMPGGGNRGRGMRTLTGSGMGGMGGSGGMSMGMGVGSLSQSFIIKKIGE